MQYRCVNALKFGGMVVQFLVLKLILRLLLVNSLKVTLIKC